MSPQRTSRRSRHALPVVILAAAALAAPVLALATHGPGAPATETAPVTATVLTGSALTLDLSQALAQPEPAHPAPTEPADAGPSPEPTALTLRGTPRKPFGFAGSEWLTFGVAAANNLGEESDFNLHAAYSQFLADELEFAIEAAGWYFAQDGDDTGGISGSMVLRWHHFHDRDYSWTVFSDVGIGLLAAFDETPQGGQEFNFLPRIGGGYTQRLNDEGARLQIGARWHHISNGRYTGDVNNPSRDSVLIYAAIVIPF